MNRTFQDVPRLPCGVVACVQDPADASASAHTLCLSRVGGEQATAALRCDPELQQPAWATAPRSCQLPPTQPAGASVLRRNGCWLPFLLPWQLGNPAIHAAGWESFRWSPSHLLPHPHLGSWSFPSHLTVGTYFFGYIRKPPTHPQSGQACGKLLHRVLCVSCFFYCIHWASNSRRLAVAECLLKKNQASQTKLA